jgi:hypothetical protein
MAGSRRSGNGNVGSNAILFWQGIARRRYGVVLQNKATAWWRPAGCGASIAWRITVRTRIGKVAFGGDSYAQAMYGWRSNATVGQGMILYCAGGVR